MIDTLGAAYLVQQLPLPAPSCLIHPTDPPQTRPHPQCGREYANPKTIHIFNSFITKSRNWSALTRAGCMYINVVVLLHVGAMNGTDDIGGHKIKVLHPKADAMWPIPLSTVITAVAPDRLRTSCRNDSVVTNLTGTPVHTSFGPCDTTTSKFFECSHSINSPQRSMSGVLFGLIPICREHERENGDITTYGCT
jgi:hypothetical protein